jgi:putative flavoprotein involved in K+ transport
MHATDVAIIGAGQAGLAMSRCLADLGIDHVLIERGEVAERWRAMRWPGLRLLTPNWMTRLPGHRYTGPEPEGFMDRAALIRLFDTYGRDAPVLAQTSVERVALDAGRYRIDTDRGVIRARAVVIATGICDRPALPDWASAIGEAAQVMHAADYAGAEAVAAGGVLVVGASSSGVQIARSLAAAGRRVTLAVGRHTRMPRRYRGRDIFDWLERTGTLAERWTAAPNLQAARRQPSMQLSGDGRIDLERLRRAGVRLAGRATGVAGGRVEFAATLAADMAASEMRVRRLLARIDGHVAATGEALGRDRSAWLAPRRPRSTPRAVDLRAEGIGAVIFATGYRRDYGWLDLPVLDEAGELVHQGGILPLPGLYALGLRFMRRRSSNFIDGVGRDAEDLAAHLAAFLGRRRLAA